MTNNFRIEAIANNIFEKISISKKENIKQWQRDKDNFEEELFNILKPLENKDRDNVLSRLEIMTQKPEKFFSASGAIDVKKIISVTQEIVQEEQKKGKSYEKTNSNIINEEKTPDTVKNNFMEHIEELISCTKPYTEGWTEDEKSTYEKLLEETERKHSKIEERKKELVEDGYSEEEAEIQAKKEIGWTEANEDIHNFSKKAKELKEAQTEAENNPNDSKLQRKVSELKGEVEELSEVVHKTIQKQNLLEKINKLEEYCTQTGCSFEEAKKKCLDENTNGIVWGDDYEKAYASALEISEAEGISIEDAIKKFYSLSEEQQRIADNFSYIRR